jgi:hypothetical protein
LVPLCKLPYFQWSNVMFILQALAVLLLIAVATPGAARDTAETLSGLDCPEAQIAKSEGRRWVCSDDENDDTLGSLICTDGQVAKFENGSWNCAADNDTPDTDTLADLDCTHDQIARYNGSTSQWECATLPVAPQETKTVFLSSQTFAGSEIGGIVGADAICNALANAAGLYGQYKAWLSDSKRALGSVPNDDILVLNAVQSDFATSPLGRFNRADVPYVRTDGVQVADDWFALTTCDGGTGQCLDAAIVFDEHGLPAPGTAESEFGAAVWSSTGTDGLLEGGSATNNDTDATCNDWEPDLDLANTRLPAFGIARLDVLDQDWTNNPSFGDPCNSKKHIYCFEQ